tara:strand:- start:385 stop:636 length:252 start_codon:yes stop_codon:yes gene_type:complete
MEETLKERLRMIIREELQSLVEASVKFDPKKVEKLITQDKFLNYSWKKIKSKYRGKEAKGYESLFNTYIYGDSDLERQYKKIK